MDSLKHIPFTIALFLIGAGFVLVGFLGHVPLGAGLTAALSIWARVALVLIGAVFAGLAVFMEGRLRGIFGRKKDKPPSPATAGSKTTLETYGANVTEPFPDAVGWAVTLDDRATAYEKLREKARKRIAILGVGMTNLSEHELDSLKSQAERVSIDLLMMDPEYLKTHPEFTCELERLFDIPYFGDRAQKSFDRLNAACQKWNNERNSRYKFRLRVYQHLPTVSMVMIDPDEANSEIIFEMFLYKSAVRPRFTLVNVKSDNRLFEAFKLEYSKVWDAARVVIP